MLEIIAGQLIGNIHHELTIVSHNVVAALEYEESEHEFIVSGWSLESGEMISENFFETLEAAREFKDDPSARSYWVTSQDCGKHEIAPHRSALNIPWLRPSQPSYELNRG